MKRQNPCKDITKAGTVRSDKLQRPQSSKHVSDTQFELVYTKSELTDSYIKGPEVEFSLK